VVVERSTEQLRVGRVGEERHTLVDDSLADSATSAAFRERAATFLGGARVERVARALDKITDRLWLEDDRIAARLDRLWVPRQPRFLDRSIRDGDLRPIGVIDARPS
jgi:hypothetical protein